MPNVWWARRDLRWADNPALSAAAADADVLPLVVLDPRLLRAAPTPRAAWYASSVLALDAHLSGRLHLVAGDPAATVPAVARACGATAVHVAAETTPFGRRRDTAVARALAAAGVGWIETGSPYAVTPGRVVKSDGSPYRVFTPFRRAWLAHGRPAPAAAPATHTGIATAPDGGAALRAELARLQDACPVRLPVPGERAALDRWRAFRDDPDGLAAYASGRDRPDADGTSRLSPYLKVGAIHPRTLLADLDDLPGAGAAALVSELAWREFYADLVLHHPSSLRVDLDPRLAGMTYDGPGGDFAAWRRGATGYPLVDAGLRQLRAEGWLPNRVRMLVASFLTKDLHIRWQHGAAHFLDHLIDGDPASNAHGWQWVAGTGSDAAPYFRVFSPLTQARRFDPHGDYVRAHVPELRHLPGAAALEPWAHPDGYAHGYPRRIVDHAVERRVALDRLAAARG